ncbi:hypothetical protein ACQKJG_18175 [Priestia megaterium]|uniref:hypothetical protein n=1 Tax=Priestia megaterium TaxID=1404 RepID=UPI003CFFEDBD
MIKVTEETSNYLRCQSCLDPKEKKLKNISVGVDEKHTRTIRLCKPCIDDLRNELEPTILDELVGEFEEL